MPQSRKNQINLAATPYYHCISRCVRRAFLCGVDENSGQSYEHRRQWVEDKLFKLSKIFTIDVCAYAVMSNHTHTVLHVDEQQAKALNTKEILIRWHQIFKGTFLTQKYINKEPLNKSELTAVEIISNVYRQRLVSISWFMRVLNESIAREANKEDGCTGRFWEGRFKSQALLDESALAACMVYVDLNPIRASIAKTPETSDYTSIKLRIKHALNKKQPSQLMPFVGNPEREQSKGLAFDIKEYIALVDFTGRNIRNNKSGFINQKRPNILKRLSINEEKWITLSKHFTNIFHGAVGSEDSLSQFCEFHHKKRRTNISNSQTFFS